MQQTVSIGLWARRADELLRTVPNAEVRERMRFDFQHRAAIGQCEHGLKRDAAEWVAFRELRARIEDWRSLRSGRQ